MMLYAKGSLQCNDRWLAEAMRLELAHCHGRIGKMAEQMELVDISLKAMRQLSSDGVALTAGFDDGESPDLSLAWALAISASCLRRHDPKGAVRDAQAAMKLCSTVGEGKRAILGSTRDRSLDVSLSVIPPCLAAQGLWNDAIAAAKRCVTVAEARLSAIPPTGAASTNVPVEIMIGILEALLLHAEIITLHIFQLEIGGDAAARAWPNVTKSNRAVVTKDSIITAGSLLDRFEELLTQWRRDRVITASSGGAWAVRLHEQRAKLFVATGAPSAALTIRRAVLQQPQLIAAADTNVFSRNVITSMLELVAVGDLADSKSDHVRADCGLFLAVACERLEDTKVSSKIAVC
jgi:hypothetical protein